MTLSHADFEARLLLAVRRDEFAEDWIRDEASIWGRVDRPTLHALNSVSVGGDDCIVYFETDQGEDYEQRVSLSRLFDFFDEETQAWLTA